MTGAVPRDTRIDALKGLAIVAVVLYHTLGQFLVTAPTLALYGRELLFSFMLPLFAFLSGHVLGRPGKFRPRAYFVRRTLGLMVPYVCWEIVYGLTKRADARRGVAGLGAYLAETLLNPHLEGRMWYLYVLWIALMALGLVRLAGDRSWMLVAAVAAAMAWPWWGAFQRLQWLFLYVVFGFLVRRYGRVLRPHVKTLGLAGALAFVPLLAVSRPERVAVARVQHLLSGSGWAGAGTAAVYGASTAAGVAAVSALVAASYNAPQGLEVLLALPGRLSLGIYVTHFAVVEAWHDPSPWLIPVIVALALAVSMAATVLIGRWRVSATLLLGERWTRRSLPLGRVRTETI